MIQKIFIRILLFITILVVVVSVGYGGITVWRTSKQASEQTDIGKIDTNEETYQGGQEIRRSDVMQGPNNSFKRMDVSKKDMTGKVHLSGRVMRKSDVVQESDVSFEGVVVIAIPSDKVELLLEEEIGFPKEVSGQLEIFGPTLSKELLEKYVQARTISQLNGEYELEVPHGNYLLCLANLDRPPERVPVQVAGCLKVLIPEGERLIQNIFWGESGVTSQ